MAYLIELQVPVIRLFIMGIQDTITEKLTICIHVCILKGIGRKTGYVHIYTHIHVYTTCRFENIFNFFFLVEHLKNISTLHKHIYAQNAEIKKKIEYIFRIFFGLLVKGEHRWVK